MPAKPKEQAACKLCRFWVPKYSGVGICMAVGAQDARFWTEKDLFTKGDFACISFNAIDTNIQDQVL